MGGLNLEVFKVRGSPQFTLNAQAVAYRRMAHQFGTYVMFPIMTMYYFGTNLDDRFAIQGFWPKPEECNKLPRDREEIKAEYERIVARQKVRQARKLEQERQLAEAHPEQQQQQHES